MHFLYKRLPNRIPFSLTTSSSLSSSRLSTLVFKEEKNFASQSSYNRKMGIFKDNRRVLCLLSLLLFTSMDASTERNGDDPRTLETQSDAGESPKGMPMRGGAAYITLNVGIFNHIEGTMQKGTMYSFLRNLLY